ncbi:PEP-CTERM sorting domain-containing protein [Aliiglaciecola sp. SL4]|uniref:PEP-CTERM sorting domain-containing protein n=1 Tax=Aliiglaciecola sp. SL4 TaxID=3239806 RepID=UPI00355C8ECE
MKFLILIFSLTLAINANAGLISTETDQNSYNMGDVVTVDIFVNELNPNLDFLELDFVFDDSQLAFVDNSWLDSDEIVNFGAFGDAFTYLSNTLIMQASFLYGITDIVGTSFQLGELQFTALTNINTPLFSSLIVTAQDVNFNDIEAQVAVPEPSGIALLSIAAVLLLIRRRQLSA